MCAYLVPATGLGAVDPQLHGDPGLAGELDMKQIIPQINIKLVTGGRVGNIGFWDRM